jgi:methylaspartate mutase sigma subunit
VVVTGVASDAHTWNLVYLQLLIEELGYEVVNLGPCVPPHLVVRRCRELDPALVVVSTVNGHGFQDGMALIKAVRAAADLTRMPVVIGGKLGVDDDESDARLAELTAGGFDAVFQDGRPVAEFQQWLGELPTRAVAAIGESR